MENINGEKLRIGILIDEFIVPAWFYTIIEVINTSSYASVVLVVKKESATVKNNSLFSKLINNRRHLAYMGYRILEDKIFPQRPSAFTQKDLKDLVSDVSVLEVMPVEKKYSDIISLPDIERIQKFNVDVFIRLGFRILKGDILKVAKNGIWSYHHGDNRVNRGGPAGVWESIEGWREMGCVLQILTPDLDSGDILYRSWSQKKVILINEGINSVYWKSTTFVPRKLKELHQMGSEAFRLKVKTENQGITFYSNRVFTTPSNAEFLLRIIKKVFVKIKLKLWFLFYFEQWILLFCFNADQRISTSIFKYKRIIPPKDRFWADPCVIYKDEKYYIFIEELIYKKNEGRAHISVIEMDENGNYSEPHIVLRRDYHLSYPFVFDYNKEFYMIPETMENSSIELYRCTAFPNQWEFVMTLMENVSAVDTTIFEKDGKVWMFTNIKERSGASTYDELFLFYSDELLTTHWVPHPLNPIVSDVKSARPAGALFFNEGKLYRPSQDSSYRYGYATVINEVVKMTTTEYVERPVTNILPKWSSDVRATHALSYKKSLTVIDAMIKRKN